MAGASLSRYGVSLSGDLIEDIYDIETAVKRVRIKRKAKALLYIGQHLMKFIFL